jgi:mannosyltransferase
LVLHVSLAGRARPLGHDLMVASSEATVARSRPRATGLGAVGDASRGAWLVVGALTVAAFVLRVVGIRASLFGDERFTHAIVSENGLPGVWHEVYTTSITPPFHYVLAWSSIQFGGDSTVLVRLPSLVLGTAMIPLVFVLARRVGGARTGVVAAAIYAFSPFAIFYSTEARAYETMVFLVTVSTLALLRAGEGAGRRWWVVYALASCAALWTHYTAVFVLAVEALWGVWVFSERRRELVIAQAAAIAGFLPWVVGGFLEQRQNEGVTILAAFGDKSVRAIVKYPLQTVIGHPFVGLADVPGNLALLLVAGVAGLAVAAAVLRPAVYRAIVPSLRSERALIVLLAFATPAGMLALGLIGPDLYWLRNLSASQPGLIVLIALVLATLSTALPPRVAVAVLGAMGAVLAIVAVQSVRPADGRPDYRDAAHYLGRVAGADPVVYVPTLLNPDARLGSSALSPYDRRPGRLYRFFDPAPWLIGRSEGRSVYLVQAREPALLAATGRGEAPAGLLERRAALGGPDGRAILRATKTFAGFYPVTVQRFSGAVQGRLERRGPERLISWTLGRRVVVEPGGARGAVDTAQRSARQLTLSGYGVDGKRPRPADWILAFSRGRLIAVSSLGALRPDLGAAFGPSVRLAGFSLAPLGPASDAPSLRVFAVSGSRASELPLSPAAKRALG